MFSKRLMCLGQHLTGCDKQEATIRFHNRIGSGLWKSTAPSPAKLRWRVLERRTLYSKIRMGLFHHITGPNCLIGSGGQSHARNKNLKWHLILCGSFIICMFLMQSCPLAIREWTLPWGPMYGNDDESFSNMMYMLEIARNTLFSDLMFSLNC